MAHINALFGHVEEHDFPSTFGEILERLKTLPKSLQEKTSDEWTHAIDGSQPTEEDREVPFSEFCNGLHSLHHSPEVKPNSLTPEQQTAIHHFTYNGNADEKEHGSSGNLNRVLRNNQLDNGNDSRISRIWKNIRHLSTIYKNPENLNRIPLTTYCGVPPNIGNRLKKSQRYSRHRFKGFMSTSTSAGIARFFAQSHADEVDSNDHHVIKFKVKPGKGLSLALHNKWKNLNEILLNRNTEGRYLGTERYPHPDGTGHLYVHTIGL